MRIDWVERRFASLFADYSTIVVAYPTPFIALPVLITAILSTGLLKHGGAFMKDELELYTPTDAQARRELSLLDSLFHINDSDPFYATRRYDMKRAGYIIVTHREEEADVLNMATMREAMSLWGRVQSLTVLDSARSSAVSYPRICVKFPMPPDFGRAINSLFSPNVSANPLVEMFKLLLVTDSSFLNRSIDEMTLSQISEAIQVDSVGMAHLLGGVTLDENRQISGAKAIMLPYALRHSSREEDWLAEQWELQLVRFLLSYHSPLIRTSWWTYETLASESARDRLQLIGMLGPCFGVVSVYTVLLCCLCSWRRSRPWLALGGVFSAAMAIVSAVGLLLLLNFGITSVAYSMPFIVFSVGVDNVFILLSAWRATPSRAGLRERMRETFADAAVSITVTSLTDLISFSVGCATPFPSVQMFCAYAVVAVIFTYIYQLTFFAAILVLTCRRELDHRHCLTFMKLRRRKKKAALAAALGLPPAYDARWVPGVVGGSVPVEDDSFEKNHCLSKFFMTTYSDMLLNPVVRVCILSAFMLYLGIASWGCTRVKLGLEPNDLLPDNSYGKRTLRIAEKYFSEYGSYLHVWMYNLTKLDSSRQSRVWQLLEREIQLYEHTEFTGSSDSWLRMFSASVKASGLLVTQDNFVYLLQNVFLSQPQYAKYARDIVFDGAGLRLEASRVPVQLRHVGAGNQSRAMHLFRSLADSSSIQTGVYADFFQFAEQYNAVLPGTLSSIAYAGVAVVLVSLILIPEPSAAIWVSFSIVSINVGILGFMTFWGVRLDFISMVTIVMSIGFCVDFAAHLAYNFSKGEDLCSSVRMRRALYAVGTPILQSASSTMLGVSFLASAESYVFRAFLKTILLVIGLGALHGLVILPVLLTLFHCNSSSSKSSTTSVMHAKMHGDEMSSAHPQEMIYSSLSSPPIKFITAAQQIYSAPPVHPFAEIHHNPLAPYLMRVRLKQSASRDDICTEKSVPAHQ